MTRRRFVKRNTFSQTARDCNMLTALKWSSLGTFWAHQRTRRMRTTSSSCSSLMWTDTCSGSHLGYQRRHRGNPTTRPMNFADSQVSRLRRDAPQVSPLSCSNNMG